MIRHPALVALAALAVALASACSPARIAPPHATLPSPTIAQQKATTLPDTTPVYTRPAPDPLVKAALAKFPTAASGSIVGYLVDFKTAVSGGGTGIYEVIVAKDGSVHRTVHQGHWRPAGAFGSVPPRHSLPQSAQENAARIAAIAAARLAIVSAIPMYSSAQPLIFADVVRLTGKDGTVRDVYVAPDGTGVGSVATPVGKLHLAPVPVIAR